MILKVGADEQERKLLINFLKENNMQYDEYMTPLHMFYEEEAEYRIEMNYEDCSEEIINRLIEEHAGALADTFLDDEYIIDCDRLDDITRDVVGEVDDESDEINDESDENYDEL
jgi:hypothetical protein